MKKLANPVRKVKAQVIGLDVHKRMTAYCILDRSGCEIACGEIDARTGHEVGYLVARFTEALNKRDLLKEIEQLRHELANARKQRKAQA